MNAMSKTCAPADEQTLPADWSRLRGMIQRSIPFVGGTHNEADLLSSVLCGHATFWPGRNCFVLASIERHPRKTKINMFLAGGDHDEVAEIEPHIIAWGKNQGATEIFAMARPALERVNENGRSGYFNDSGYRRVSALYAKEI